MNLYGYSLQKGVIFSACIEMVAATINMILSAVWAGDLNFCHSLPPRYQPCIRYRVYVSMAVISAWIILCDLLICWAAFQKNLKVMRICVPLSLFVTIANVSILGVLAGYYRRSALAGVIIYLCVYMIFKCYFMPMIKNFYMVLFVENGGVLVTQISPYLGGGIYPNMQKPYPNVQYPQGQNQNPIPPPSYEQQQYPNAQQPYPNIQQPYPNVQQPYPNVQQPYPNVQQPYPNVQQPYPNVQQPYPNVQQPYPNVQQPYPNVQQPYPNVQQPYPNGQQPYPNDQQTYPNDPQSFPNVPSYISKY